MPFQKRIQQAKEAGFADDEILSALSKDPSIGQRIQTATAQNFSSTEILEAVSSQPIQLGSIPSVRPEGRAESLPSPKFSKVPVLSDEYPVSEKPLPIEPMQGMPWYEQISRGVVKELPTALAMFGGGVAALPPGPTSPIRAIAGTGLGGAAGENLKQIIEQRIFGELPPEDPLYEIGKAGVISAASEMTGQTLTAGLSKILAPGAAKLTAKSKALLKYAKEQDLPISPDVFTDSKFVKGVVNIADNVPPGEYVMDAHRLNLSNKITKMRDNFITDVLEMPAPSTQEAFRQQAKELYGSLAEEAGGKAAKYHMANTQQYLTDTIDDMIPALRTKKSKDFFRLVKRKLDQSGQLKWEEIQDLTSKAWSGRYSKLDQETKAVWAGFKKAVDSDIVEIDKVANTTISNLLESARSAYKSAAEAGKAAQIEKIFRASTDFKEGKYIFQPLKFAKALEARSSFLQRRGVSLERIELLKNFADKMMVAAPDIERLAKAQSVGKTLVKGGLRTGVAASLFQQPALVVPAGFDVMATFSIMNPKGWMKEWLTTGLKPGIGTEALKQSLKPISLRMFEKGAQKNEQRSQGNLQSQ